MRPFFTFYGGKWRVAPHFPAPRYDTIIEPFAGSAGYSVRYEPEMAILNDVDPVIYGIWEWLIESNSSTILDLPLLDLASGPSTMDLDIPQPARDLIGFWINKGTERPFRTPSKWVRSGIRPKSSWGDEVRALIAAQMHTIDGWQVHSSPYWALPDVEATWFIDPPYQGPPGKRYVYGNDGIDYVKLAEWCRSRSGQVIVCENEGADWLPFRPLADIKTSREKRSKEVIWSNDLGSPA